MLQEFLGALKDDHIRGEADISSLGSRGASKSEFLDTSTAAYHMLNALIVH